MAESLFETQFACEIWKLMSDRKTRYSILNAENHWVVTNDVMFVYVQEKINILFWVFFFFLFFMI